MQDFYKRIRLLEESAYWSLGYKAGVLWFSFFFFLSFWGEWGEGRVWGRVWRGNPQHNSQSKDDLNEKEGNYCSYAGNSQITLHIQLGSLYWILYPSISNMSIQCSANSSAVPQPSPSSFFLWDVLFIFNIVENVSCPLHDLFRCFLLFSSYVR